MARAFSNSELVSVKFYCESKECKSYEHYHKCKQCSRNFGLEGRHAFRDRFVK